MKLQFHHIQLGVEVPHRFPQVEPEYTKQVKEYNKYYDPVQ